MHDLLVFPCPAAQLCGNTDCFVWRSIAGRLGDEYERHPVSPRIKTSGFYIVCEDFQDDQGSDREELVAE